RVGPGTSHPRSRLMPETGSRTRPLDGLKIIELGALIAGPFCAKILAEFGAEVIKIEPPGHGDPRRTWRYLTYGTSLWCHVQSRVGVSIGDTLSALYGVIGAMFALQHRQRDGRGQMVDVALYESVFSVMESMLPEFDAFGVIRERTGSILPGIAPTSAYRCSDGSFVLIAGNGDSIFKRLCLAMGRDDLAGDASLAQNDGRALRQQWLDGEIEAWTQTRAPAEILAAMDKADVPASKIYSIRDIVADAHYAARAMIREITLAD